MKIRMNDESISLPDKSTITDLCKNFHLEPQGVIVSVDGNIIPKEKYDGYVLKENAAVDIMLFVGGG